ncbi:MAG: B12-binding domain-containing radical SAM protein [Myxococcales bacterium]|nr:B12-binding domain-containing radical SAM protein [Myxococcales bacterium]
MLLGEAEICAPDAPRLLLIKARIDDHQGEASAPAQGTMLLGAVARACGWQVRAIDSYLEADPDGAIREALAGFPAQVVGLSSLTAEHRSMHHFASVVRAARPDAIILAGGAHPSAEPEATAADPAIDAAVIGEGETTLCEILERVAAGAEWRGVAGLCYRSADGSIERTEPRANIEDLDSLPLPAWDLTDIDAYARRRGMSLAGQRRYMALTTSRGCPYRCTYCHDIQGKRFRAHSPKYVLAMIDALRARYDVHDFDITDDIFNFDAERMMTICDGLIERGGIGFTCPNGIRADRMTVEQADRMARAGCQYVAIAIESATPRIQKQIRKHLRFDKALPVIEAFTARRVFTSGFFMVGFPGESEAELQQTIDFALGSKLHAAYFFVVTPFGGTEIFGQVVDTLGREATALTGSGMFFRPQKNLSQVPDRRFYRMRRSAYLRFYLDPRRIGRILGAHPRRKDLFQYFATMLTRDALRIEPGRLLAPLSRLRGGVPRTSPRTARATAATGAARKLPVLSNEPGLVAKNPP